jgi:sarcosine oxidase subunit alpha
MALPRQPNRLGQGNAIDRSQALTFTYNGRAMTGYRGDTVASALIANGVRIIGRSFKYHRPRGFYGAGVEDPNAMLAVRDAYGDEPAIRAGQVPLSEGLDVRSITGWPSAERDLGAVAGFAGNILSAGFYYKTMMWPSWKLFEPYVRRATGFGRLTADRTARSVQHRHAVADVLVIGAGAAGLEAALALSGQGLKLILAEMEPMLGGTLSFEEATIDGVAARAWVAAASTTLASDCDVTILASTTVGAAYENNIFSLVETIHDGRGVCAERHWLIHARYVLLATGMVERPLLFAHNDRPGVMLASAVRRLIAQYGVTPARKLVVYANNDSGYLTAMAAKGAGVEVAAVLDTRPEAAAIHADAARSADIKCLHGCVVVDVAGRSGVSAVVVQTNGRAERIPCDGVAVAGGWTPLIHLAGHRGCKPVFDEGRSMFVAPQLPPRWWAAGGAAGTTDLAQSLAEGRLAAVDMLAAEGLTAHACPVRRVESPGYGSVSPTWRPPAGASDKIWVDLQNDVKVSDIEIATRENYVSVEHLKRYTTLGMGTDQGRTSNVNGLAVLAELTGRSISEVGTTSFRPMFSSVRMSTVAGGREGDLHRPRRYLPADAVHRRLGAEFEDFGWERPDWYRSNGADREAAVRAEMAAVRGSIGVFDASSLGKIEVAGPDSARFLARFYVSNMATLKPGFIRYSLMLAEDGVIFDDGVVACLGENRFLAGPTSGHAEAVAAWFERWRQTEWPDSRVSISNVTSNWGTIAIAGPMAREVLRRLDLDFDIGRDAFGHMQIREGIWMGVPVRVARVSFTGELQYEVSVQARYAESLLQVLLETSGNIVPRPVGMEAWLRLRLEKGYIHLGSDTNGRTGPAEVGFGPLVARRDDDFIGKRSTTLPFGLSRDREQLVGLVALNGRIEVGARVLKSGYSAPPCPTDGYVTSACESASAGKSIGLALVERGFQRKGEQIALFSSGLIVRARIVEPVFYDPENERLRC